PFLDENIEEFLKEYSSGNLTSLTATNNNSNSSSSTPPTLVPTPSIQKNNNCPSTAQKRKAMSNISAPMPVKRTSSISSMD
ncbi:unnamed protein product, partial [Rotaria socialis]